ncbi:MAG: bifunctional demethylmenaquinone methyltransferase/2-methoxy-6-polyprenyl-1,4-benzoquinol methylase UbiE [Armatimonadetes bacterium]|nr:bifunctional demethylmenaquinone methyltransferase/2-methoxy-6-polyprenyl-1,4-benzoquinol methylase UbiE [Armatimonadota bacterium]
MSKYPAGEEKEAYVERLFSSVAPKYDFMNSVLSLTRHKAWRRFAVSKSGLLPGGRALDVCCGTGDFAFELAKKVGSKGSVTGIDFSVPMIELARHKAGRIGCDWVEFLVGNVCKLPFPDNSFDCVTVGFGLRNVADVTQALAEMTRVTKPGGKVICLEISRVRSVLLRLPWKLYFYALTPYTARLFRARRNAYEYLPQSVKEFMSREELAAVFERSGLRDVGFHDLMLGAVCLHVGAKPL